MSLFTSKPFQSLVEQESRLLTKHLGRARGTFGLSLQPGSMPALPAVLRNWVQLQVGADGLADGTLRADGAELPFVDNSLDIVVMRHVVEYVNEPHALVREASRVLAADGLMLVAGMHPFSLWSPWMWQQAHASGSQFQALSPARWRSWLASADVNVAHVDGFGAPTPWGGGRSRPGFMGAGYILVAQKRRTPRSGTPVMSSIRQVRAAGSMACMTRRRCA